MKKLKVKWIPDLEQDLIGITTKGSLMYNEEFTNQIIKRFGSVDNYRKSDEFIKKKADFDSKINLG